MFFQNEVSLLCWNSSCGFSCPLLFKTNR